MGKAKVGASPMMDQDYQAQDDSRTLARAEEIKMNRGRHAKAKRFSLKQAKAHAKVAGADVTKMEKGYM